MKKFITSACLMLLLCLVVQADQVTLKNGDRLTGKIVKSDAKTLVFKAEFGGEVSLP